MLFFALETATAGITIIGESTSKSRTIISQTINRAAFAAEIVPTIKPIIVKR